MDMLNPPCKKCGREAVCQACRCCPEHCLSEFGCGPEEEVNPKWAARNPGCGFCTSCGRRDCSHWKTDYLMHKYELFDDSASAIEAERLMAETDFESEEAQEYKRGWFK